MAGTVAGAGGDCYLCVDPGAGDLGAAGGDFSQPRTWTRDVFRYLALWIACFLLTYTFPLLNAGLGAAGSFLLYGVICAAGYLYILRNVPETKGITLEALEEQLAQRHTGVNAAKQEQMR